MATAGILLRHLIWALVSAFALSKGTSVSKEEYGQMKRFLSFMNRSHVKSIKTKYGEIFYCVDIDKQPALDHPSLKNHTIQMRPTSLPKSLDVAPVTSKASTSFGLPDGGCPPETVPLRRVQMGDLLRAGSVTKFMSKVSAGHPHKYAVINSKAGNYLGSEMSLSLWKPQLASNYQFSLSQFWLSSTRGQGGLFNSIEAGWQVYPYIYGDNLTHLFTYWTADGYNNTGCYNTWCRGFVQESQVLAPGMVLEPVSTIGGDQYNLHLYVHKDNVSGNWWLTHGADYQLIGYWPSVLFSGLDEYAELVQWGAETLPVDDDYPPMGSGLFAEEGLGRSAYIEKIEVVDADGKKVAPTDVSYVETPACYTLVDGGNSPDGRGRHFYYGGPGGKCDNTTTHLRQVI